MSDTPPLCARVRELASAYLDGRLPAEKRARIQDHLRECSACKAEYLALKRLTGLSRSTLPEAPPRADLHERLSQSLRDRPMSGPQQKPLGRAWTALNSSWHRLAPGPRRWAASILVGLGLLGAYQLGRQHPASVDEPAETSSDPGPAPAGLRPVPARVTDPLPLDTFDPQELLASTHRSLRDGWLEAAIRDDRTFPVGLRSDRMDELFDRSSWTHLAREVRRAEEQGFEVLIDQDGDPPLFRLVLRRASAGESGHTVESTCISFELRGFGGDLGAWRGDSR